MNIDSKDAPLVLLCPAWRKWGTATGVKPNTTILHSTPGDESLRAMVKASEHMKE